MGPGGMHSFGHAAYFGLGAYGAALAVKWFAVPMAAALMISPLAAALGALVFGWFSVRLSGVYLAMLTLAFAQIVWSIVFQWQDITGGSNGILGIWPIAPFDGSAFFLLTLAPSSPAWWCCGAFCSLLLATPCVAAAIRHCALKNASGQMLSPYRDRDLEGTTLSGQPRQRAGLRISYVGAVARIPCCLREYQTTECSRRE